MRNFHTGCWPGPVTSTFSITVNLAPYRLKATSRMSAAVPGSCPPNWLHGKAGEECRNISSVSTLTLTQHGELVAVAEDVVQPLEASVVGVREAALAGHVHHQHRAARQRGEVNLGQCLESASVDIRYLLTKIFVILITLVP